MFVGDLNIKINEKDRFKETSAAKRRIAHSIIFITDQRLTDMLTVLRVTRSLKKIAQFSEL